MLDNFDVAVMTKLNELADQRGLKPYDFVATLKWDAPASKYVLRFELLTAGNSPSEERYEKMLNDLDIANDPVTQLVGTPRQIIDALDNALSPKFRLRL